MFARLRPYTVLMEAGLLGLFFVQALRYVIAALYSRIASAGLVSAYANGSYDTTVAGIVDPAVVSNEIMFLGVVIALPLLTLLIGRLRFAPLLGAIILIAGRALMTFPIDAVSPLLASEIAIAGGLGSFIPRKPPINDSGTVNFRTMYKFSLFKLSNNEVGKIKATL